MPPKTDNQPPAPTVNRKKQKRREKQAARLADQEADASARLAAAGLAPDIDDEPQYDVSGLPISDRVRQYINGFSQNGQTFDGSPTQAGEEQYYTEDDHPLAEKNYHYTNGYANGQSHMVNGDGSKGKRKKRGKSNATSPNTATGHHMAYHGAFAAPPPPPPSIPPDTLKDGPGISKERIWNTSTGEERERIKEFWLSLGEEERRGLVKIEKEAVLKKMKEQQKTSCSCTLCGRKRVAIEEELEVLYDAYYEELESYANHQQVAEDGTPILPPNHVHASSSTRPIWSRKPPPDRRVQEVYEGDEDDEEDYSEDEDEDYSDDEPLQANYGAATDFFNFGNSLTVQGGILTVADDLLKNDGKKFIDMMEQLAERRMQREEVAAYNAVINPNGVVNHGHALPVDDEAYDEEEDEDDYDSAEDEEEGTYEDDLMNENQRMEEGRRMFQIFAARMFEQRVLSAYKDKVAIERQQKLIEELDEESRLDKAREEKKAREAQKKKEKKRMQKQAKDEEKHRKDAEKALEEAQRKAAEEKKLEEQRLKKEEQRKKRDAEKKAQDEERQRKEADKQRKLQEARDQQAEQERRQREQKEREKKKKDEQRKKEREDKEAKDREAAEKKEAEAEALRKREKARSEKQSQERRTVEEQGARNKSTTGITAQPLLKTQPSATNLQPPAKITSSSKSSPHLPVAVPAVPKAPTPVRPPPTTSQGVYASPQPAYVNPLGATSPPHARSPPSHNNRALSIDTQNQSRLPPVQYPAGSFSPRYSHPPQPPGLTGPLHHPPGFLPNNVPIAPPGIQRFPAQEPIYNSQQAFVRNAYPNHAPPGAIGSRPIGSTSNIGSLPPSQTPIGPPSVARANAGINVAQQSENMPPQQRSAGAAHSRQTSATYDQANSNAPLSSAATQPIARPAPIQRPSSVAPSHPKKSASAKGDVDDLSVHLGSSALLGDDDDVPLVKAPQSRRSSMAPGEARRPVFNNHMFNTSAQSNPQNFIWGPPPTPSSSSTISTPLSAAFMSRSRSLPPTHVCDNARKQIVGFFNTLNGLQLARGIPHTGWHPLQNIWPDIERQMQGHEARIDPQLLIQLCEMDGTLQNGGGKFEIAQNGTPTNGAHYLANVVIKFDYTGSMPPRNHGPVGTRPNIDAPGILSPRIGNPPPGLGNVRGMR